MKTLKNDKKITNWMVFFKALKEAKDVKNDELLTRILAGLMIAGGIGMSVGIAYLISNKEVITKEYLQYLLCASGMISIFSAILIICSTKDKKKYIEKYNNKKSR